MTNDNETDLLRLEPHPMTDPDDEDEEPEPIDLSVLERVDRAKYREMIVIPQYDAEGYCIGLYDIYSPSGSRYLVDAESVGACDCPDAEYNSPAMGCQHWQRVKMMLARDECPLPARDEPVDDYMTGFLADVVEVLLERENAVHEDLEATEAEHEAVDNLILPVEMHLQDTQYADELPFPTA